MSDNKFNISFYKRPWPIVLMGAFWLLLEIFIIQTALASSYEREPRAVLISWIFAIVLAAVYVAVWLRTIKK